MESCSENIDSFNLANIYINTNKCKSAPDVNPILMRNSHRFYTC